MKIVRAVFPVAVAAIALACSTSGGGAGGGPPRGPSCSIDGACWSCAQSQCTSFATCVGTTCSAYFSCYCACTPGDSGCYSECAPQATSDCMTCLQTIDGSCGACSNECSSSTLGVPGDAGAPADGGDTGSDACGAACGVSSADGGPVCTPPSQCGTMGLIRQYCQDGTSCYWTVGSQTIGCTSCTDITACSQAADSACP